MEKKRFLMGGSPYKCRAEIDIWDYIFLFFIYIWITDQYYDDFADLIFDSNNEYIINI